MGLGEILHRVVNRAVGDDADDDDDGDLNRDAAEAARAARSMVRYRGPSCLCHRPVRDGTTDAQA